MPSDFEALHAAMRRWVDRELLAGVSIALLRGPEVVDLHCEGFADVEAGVRLTGFPPIGGPATAAALSLPSQLVTIAIAVLAVR